MKKFIFAVLVLCIVFSDISVFAGDDVVNRYTLSYDTGTELNIESTSVKGKGNSLEVIVSKKSPQKEGFRFVGWSYHPQDYVNSNIIQPGSEILLDSSTVLYAVWHKEDERKITYMDGQREILPSQRTVIGETVKISEIVPRKAGYAFSGWQYTSSGKNFRLMPGESVTVDGNVVLIAMWERGDVAISAPEIVISESGMVTFVFDGAEEFDDATVEVCELKNGSKREMGFEGNCARMKNSVPGAYEAYISGEKYGILYEGEKVNFVVPEAPEKGIGDLTVFMDGKELYFDLPPVLIGQYTYVTLRYFCEYLGADVLWDDGNRTAIITYNGTRMKIKENSDLCVINGSPYLLPAPTVIMSSRMFIPLRSVAELCNCEVIWDPSQKVYMFSEQKSIFESNMFTLSGKNGKFMGISDNVPVSRVSAEMDSVWLFDAVDSQRGIYEIYNLCELSKPLEVRLSDAYEGAELRVCEKSGYDGYLWKVTEYDNGEYYIQLANNEELYLDVSNMCITTTATRVRLDAVYR